MDPAREATVRVYEPGRLREPSEVMTAASATTCKAQIPNRTANGSFLTLRSPSQMVGSVYHVECPHCDRQHNKRLQRVGG